MTTKRIERQFWSLKVSMSESFYSIPDIVSAIVQSVNFTDNRLSVKVFDATKSLIIYDSDKSINKLYKKSCQHLKGTSLYDIPSFAHGSMT